VKSGLARKTVNGNPLHRALLKSTYRFITILFEIVDTGFYNKYNCAQDAKNGDCDDGRCDDHFDGCV
jgi:hypothetical protein